MNQSFLCYSQQFSRVPWSMIKYISIIFLIKFCLLYLSLWPNWNWFLCGIRSGTSFVIFHMDSRMPLLSYIKAPSYCSHCCAQMRGKKQLKGWRICFSSQVGGAVHPVSWRLFAHIPADQETKKGNVSILLAFFSPLSAPAIDSATPFRMGLPFSVKHLWSHPYNHSQEMYLTNVLD